MRQRCVFDTLTLVRSMVPKGEKIGFWEAKQPGITWYAMMMILMQRKQSQQGVIGAKTSVSFVHR